MLETEGLVTVQRGNVGGAIVHAPRAGKVAYMLGLVLQHQGVAIRDIAQTLVRLDPACAALCAERTNRRRSVVPLLRANLRESKRVIADPEKYAPVAHDFHWTSAIASPSSAFGANATTRPISRHGPTSR